MTESHFQAQLNRLVDTFGKNSLTTERMKLIWREVHPFSAEWFTSVIDGFIASSRQAPLPDDFSAAAAKEREKLHGRAKQEKGDFDWGAAANCSFCSDTGVYLCRRNDEPGVWAFRCHCTKGENDPRVQIPQYKKAHQEQGFTYFEVKPTQLKSVNPI